jgi:hypothetical protein
MSREILRDGQCEPLGYIDEDYNGDAVIHDRQGNYLGRYIASFNITEDRSGNRVGTGNLLTRLIR